MFRRLVRSLRETGFKGTVAKAYVLGVDRWFDWKNRTETRRFLEQARLAVSSPNRQHGHGYMATRVVPLRRLLRDLKPNLPERRVLLDLGCGKGRVLMVASEFGFRKVKGVEFAPDLCQVARTNCSAFKQTNGVQTDFNIIESDVVDYPIQPEENVFFLYNPFDETVLKQVLANIAASLERAPREVVVIYCNPRLRNVIEHGGFLNQISDYSYWGYRFAVYANLGLRCLQLVLDDDYCGAWTALSDAA